MQDGVAQIGGGNSNTEGEGSSGEGDLPGAVVFLPECMQSSHKQNEPGEHRGKYQPRHGDEYFFESRRDGVAGIGIEGGLPAGQVGKGVSDTTDADASLKRLGSGDEEMHLREAGCHELDVEHGGEGIGGQKAAQRAASRGVFSDPASEQEQEGSGIDSKGEIERPGEGVEGEELTKKETKPPAPAIIAQGPDEEHKGQSGKEQDQSVGTCFGAVADVPRVDGTQPDRDQSGHGSGEIPRQPRYGQQRKEARDERGNPQRPFAKLVNHGTTCFCPGIVAEAGQRGIEHSVVATAVIPHGLLPGDRAEGQLAASYGPL